MTTFEPGTRDTDLVEDDLTVLREGDAVDTSHACVVCGAPVEAAGCCSFDCVRDARRELDDNLARLYRLQTFDGPTATRTRLTERNGRLTAALMGWRQ